MNYTQAVHSPQRIRGGRHGRENGIINNGSVGAIGGRSIGGIGGDGAIVSPQPEELKLFLQDMLQKMESEFSDLGSTILGRMDEVGQRMDELEQNLSGLMEQAGLGQQDDASQITTPRSTPANSPKPPPPLPPSSSSSSSRTGRQNGESAIL